MSEPHHNVYPDIATHLSQIIETAIRDFCRKSPGFPDLSLTAMAQDVAAAVTAALPDGVAQPRKEPIEWEMGADGWITLHHTASVEAVRKHHADEWKRQIINAGGDENVAQQAVALAALNGLFDHFHDAQSPTVGVLHDIYITMRHAKTFITSREKMHPTGVELWDRLFAQIEVLQPSPMSSTLRGGPDADRI